MEDFAECRMGVDQFPGESYCTVESWRDWSVWWSNRSGQTISTRRRRGEWPCDASGIFIETSLDNLRLHYSRHLISGLFFVSAAPQHSQNNDIRVEAQAHSSAYVKSKRILLMPYYLCLNWITTYLH